MYFRYFIIISPWKKVGLFIWTNLSLHYPIKNTLCQVWLKLAKCFRRRRFFLISSMYFRNFIIISPWKRAGSNIWTNLNPLHSRMLCAKFGWNWTSGFWEEVENRKSLQTNGQRDRQTREDRRSEKAHLSFQLRWAKNESWFSCIRSLVK